MRHSRPHIIATVVLGLTGGLLLAGCSSGSTGAASPGGAPTSGSPSSNTTAPTVSHGDGTACSLITEQEATTALGTDPGTGAADSKGPATSCTFGAPSSMLRVDLVPTGGKVGYEHALGIAQANPVVTISGVGDGAFGVFNGTLGAIDFYKGDSVVIVLLTPLDASTTSQDKLTALAKEAAGRL